MSPEAGLTRAVQSAGPRIVGLTVFPARSHQVDGLAAEVPCSELKGRPGVPTWSAQRSAPTPTAPVVVGLNEVASANTGKRSMERQKRPFCAARPRRTRYRRSAHSRRSVATEDSACDRRAPLARWRVPPVASGQPCRSARRSCRGQAGAPPAAWHTLGAAAARPQRRQVAPRRAVSAPCHRAGAPGAPMLRHRRSPPAGRTAARRKQSWPDPLRRRQESPAKKAPRNPRVQGSGVGKGTFLPGQGILGPSWHTPSASHASNSALCRDQITADRQAHRAAALLYFAAVQGS